MTDRNDSPSLRVRWASYKALREDGCGRISAFRLGFGLWWWYSK